MLLDASLSFALQSYSQVALTVCSLPAFQPHKSPSHQWRQQQQARAGLTSAANVPSLLCERSKGKLLFLSWLQCCCSQSRRLYCITTQTLTHAVLLTPLLPHKDFHSRFKRLHISIMSHMWTYIFSHYSFCRTGTNNFMAVQKVLMFLPAWLCFPVVFLFCFVLL